MPVDNKLLFTKTSVHILLYPLNWNLFSRHKDNLEEPISCSTAEIVQKMDTLAFVYWLIPLSWRSFRGPQDEELLQPEGAPCTLCQEVRHPQLWERPGTFRASLWKPVKSLYHYKLNCRVHAKKHLRALSQVS